MLYWRFRLELLRPGVLGGREDEVQPLQGVHSLMAELLPLEQLDESAVKLVQLRLLDLPGNDTHRTLCVFQEAKCVGGWGSCS